MKTSSWIAVVVVVLVALGAWYYYMRTPAPAYPNTNAGVNGSPNQGNLGSDTGMPDQGVQQPQGDGTSVSQNLIVGQASSAAVGNYLTAYNGMTLYTYSPDEASPGKSVCNGTCAANWPPYIVGTVADIHVPSSITGKVSTIVRADGALQVTYNGNPLYFYVKDTKSGDTTGQGVGGVWYVVKP